MTGQTLCLAGMKKILRCALSAKRRRSRGRGRNELARFRASGPIIHTRNYFSAGSAKFSNRRFHQVKEEGGRATPPESDDDGRAGVASAVKWSASVTFLEWEDKKERIMPPMIYVAIGRPQHLYLHPTRRKEGRKEDDRWGCTRRGRPLDAYTRAINLFRAASLGRPRSLRIASRASRGLSRDGRTRTGAACAKLKTNRGSLTREERRLSSSRVRIHHQTICACHRRLKFQSFRVTHGPPTLFSV